MASPLDFFQAGQAGGRANAFPDPTGNIMDMFNKQIENQMKLQQMAGLFKGEKDYEWSNSPQSREATAKLNASGLGDGSQGGAPGQGAGGLATIAGVGGPPSQGGGALSQNAPTKFTSVTGQTFENQEAQTTEEAAKKLIDQRADMIHAGNAMDEIADLQKNYESGINVGGSGFDPKRGSNPLINTLNSKVQGANMNINRLSNPEWQKYMNFKKNISYFTDRYLWGEKGKLIGQQLDAGVQTLPDGETPKTTAYGNFSKMYDAAGRSISSYNQQVRQIFGPNSPYEVHPKNEQYIEKQHQRAKALGVIQSGQSNPDDVNNAFKNNYGEDV